MLGAFRETKSIATTFCNYQLVERAREITVSCARFELGRVLLLLCNSQLGLV